MPDFPVDCHICVIYIKSTRSIVYYYEGFYLSYIIFSLGKFSTCPYDNRLYLADILDHISSPFPSKAVMYMNIDSNSMNDAIPTHLSSSVVTLKVRYIQKECVVFVNIYGFLCGSVVL